MNIGFIIYLIAGYWATGETIYANKVVFYTGISFFITRMDFNSSGNYKEAFTALMMR